MRALPLLAVLCLAAVVALGQPAPEGVDAVDRDGSDWKWLAKGVDTGKEAMMRGDAVAAKRRLAAVSRRLAKELSLPDLPAEFGAEPRDIFIAAIDGDDGGSSGNAASAYFSSAPLIELSQTPFGVLAKLLEDIDDMYHMLAVSQFAKRQYSQSVKAVRRGAFTLQHVFSGAWNTLCVDRPASLSTPLFHKLCNPADAQGFWARSKIRELMNDMSHLQGMTEGQFEKMCAGFLQAAVDQKVLMHRHQRPNMVLNQTIFPAVPFWDSNLFAWRESLESQWETIRDEALASLVVGDFESDMARLRQGQLPEKRNTELWGLAGSRRGNEYDRDLIERTDEDEDGQKAEWWELVFYDRGTRNDRSAKACPVTARAMDALTDATNMFTGQIHFSLLPPRTYLKPHCGGTNYRLTAHLPIAVPAEGGGGLQVAGETRIWEEGKLLVFDDSFEHSAYNDSDEFRIVLLINFWHPHLDSEEVRREIERLNAWTPPRNQ